MFRVCRFLSMFSIVFSVALAGCFGGGGGGGGDDDSGTASFFRLVLSPLLDRLSVGEDTTVTVMGKQGSNPTLSLDPSTTLTVSLDSASALVLDAELLSDFQIKFTPLDDGTAKVVVKAVDEENNELSTSTFTIVVLNDPPIILEQPSIAFPSGDVYSGAAVGLKCTADDINSDPLLYSWEQTAGTSVSIVGNYVLMPSSSENFVSIQAPSVTADVTLKFKCVVSDPDSASVTSNEVTMVVKPATSTSGGTGTTNNHAPSFTTQPTADSAQVESGSGDTVRISLAVSDPDGNTTTVSSLLVSGPSVVLHGSAGSWFFIAPAVSAADMVKVKFVVSDGKLSDTSDVVSVAVYLAGGTPSGNTVPSFTNQPVVSPSSIQSGAGDSARVTFKATDADGDDLDYELLLSGMTGATGAIRTDSTAVVFAPSGVISDATLTIQVKASDDSTSTTSNSVNLIIRAENPPGNTAPVFDAQPSPTMSTLRSGFSDSAVIHFRASDADSDPLTYSSVHVSGPSRSLVIRNDTTLVVLPVSGITSAETSYFAVKADDGSTSTNSANVAIAIVPEVVNGAPSVPNDPTASPSQVLSGVATTVSMTITGATDPEGDSLSFAWSQTGGNTAIFLTGQTDSTSTILVDMSVSSQHNLIFRCAVSDTAGNTTNSQTVTVEVHPQQVIMCLNSLVSGEQLESVTAINRGDTAVVFDYVTVTGTSVSATSVSHNKYHGLFEVDQSVLTDGYASINYDGRLFGGLRDTTIVVTVSAISNTPATSDVNDTWQEIVHDTVHVSVKAGTSGLFMDLPAYMTCGQIWFPTVWDLSTQTEVTLDLDFQVSDTTKARVVTVSNKKGIQAKNEGVFNVTVTRTSDSATTTRSSRSIMGSAFAIADSSGREVWQRNGYSSVVTYPDASRKITRTCRMDMINQSGVMGMYAYGQAIAADEVFTDLDGVKYASFTLSFSGTSGTFKFPPYQPHGDVDNISDGNSWLWDTQKKEAYTYGQFNGGSNEDFAEQIDLATGIVTTYVGGTYP